MIVLPNDMYYVHFSVTDLQVTQLKFSSLPTFIMVTWTPPNVGVDAISSYSIQWQPLDNSFDGNSTTAMENEANITQLIPGKAYLITVTSVNNQTELGALRTTSVSGEHAASKYRIKGLHFRTTQ